MLKFYDVALLKKKKQENTFVKKATCFLIFFGSYLGIFLQNFLKICNWFRTVKSVLELVDRFGVSSSSPQAGRLEF